VLLILIYSRSYANDADTKCQFVVTTIGVASGVSTCETATVPPSFLYIIDWYISVHLCAAVFSNALRRSVPLAYGAMLMVLAVYKATQYWREVGFSGSKLVLVLLQDQVVYFALYVYIAFSRSFIVAHRHHQTWPLEPSRVQFLASWATNSSISSRHQLYLTRLGARLCSVPSAVACSSI
jgi:hypothetical protein